MGSPADSSAKRVIALQAENQELRNRLAKLEITEHELRKQKDLLQGIFDHLPLMINVVSADGRIEAVNREWERTLGWKFDDLAAQDVESLAGSCFPDPQVRERAFSFIREHKAEWTEFPVRTRDGRLLETVWTNVPLADGRSLGIGQDITERKRAERGVRESEELYKAIHEYGPMGIAVADVNGRLTLVNPAFRKMLGYEQDELVGVDFRDFTFEDDLLVENVYMQEVAKGRLDHYSLEKRYIHKDGRLIWVALLANVLRDYEGKPAFGLAMTKEITERKQAEEVLRRTEAFLADAESLSHIGSWAFDPLNRRIAYWSPEHYRIWGFDPSEGIPSFSAVCARIHPDDLGALAAFERAVAEKRETDAEYRIVLPDGSVRHIHSIGHPVVSVAGDFVGFTGMAMDVTERKQAETELQRSSQQLRALAVRLNRAREDEGRRIARELHDELGSSLSSLKWDLEELEHALEERLDPDAVRSRLRSMTALADSTIRVVKRISSELRPVILDDLGLVEAVEWQCQEFKARSGISCQLEIIGESIPFSLEHSTAIFRIVQEALTNVLRHAKATSVKVEFEHLGLEVFLRIADNGCGIATGLASNPLSLGILGMRERAHLLGASVDVAGRAGQGTQVTLHIPVSNSSAG